VMRRWLGGGHRSVILTDRELASARSAFGWQDALESI
jgi:hypothetical protein